MTKAFKKLVAALEAGYLESKKQQDHLFKVLNGRNEEAKEIVKTAFAKHEEIKLSKEQQEQGRKWLLNLWLTPTGKERKNNPFSDYEQTIIANFSYATLSSFYFHGYIGNAYPVYAVYDTEGDSFGYICIGSKIKKVG